MDAIPRRAQGASPGMITTSPDCTVAGPICLTMLTLTSHRTATIVKRKSHAGRLSPARTRIAGPASEGMTTEEFGPRLVRHRTAFRVDRRLGSTGPHPGGDEQDQP